MTRKRSKYKPRPIMHNTMAWVKSGFYKVSTHPATSTLALANHSALEALRKGEATKSDVKVLADMLNIVEALTEVNPAFGVDYKSDIREMQDSIVSLSQRGKERGAYICTAKELDALRYALELHDAQLDIATVNDIAQAMDIIKRTVASGNATPL